MYRVGPFVAPWGPWSSSATPSTPPRKTHRHSFPGTARLILTSAIHLEVLEKNDTGELPGKTIQCLWTPKRLRTLKVLGPHDGIMGCNI